MGLWGFYVVLIFFVTEFLNALYILSGGLAVLEKPGRLCEMKHLAIYFPEEQTDSRTMTWGRELTRSHVLTQKRRHTAITYL
jgi:hypothetical protein